MPTPGAKQGALTQADIRAIWEGACDSSFTQGLEQAGEGAGFEAYTQMFAQYARASQAVDVSTQAMYLLPSSGQTNPPAGGAAQATVQLTFSRAHGNPYVSWPLVVAPGTVFVDEVQNDWGTNGPVQVATGRRYLVTQWLVIPPGDLGPYSATATAELPGYGYNNPLPAFATAGGVQVPASIRLIDQPGSGYFHDRASLVVTPAGAPGSTSLATSPPAAVATLVAVNEPDMFLPQHVGQYVLMTAGANAGKVGRVASYVAPGTLAPASAVTLAYDQCVETSDAAQVAFVPGEQLRFTSGGTLFAVGVALSPTTPGSAPGRQRTTYVLSAGAPGLGLVITGVLSGLTSAPIVFLADVLAWTPAGTVPPNPSLAPGSGENWRVLDWASDLGVSVTHSSSPSGGSSGVLDELGRERDIQRIAPESDDAYRRRVSQVADVVTPNAVRRAITRALGGVLGCYRDTQEGMPGFFYDRRADPNGDYYDTDCLVMTSTTPFADQVGLTIFPNSPVAWTDAAGLLVARGFFGGLRPGSTTVFFFVMRGGPQNEPPLRTTFAAGDAVAIAAVPLALSAVAVPACMNGMRFALYLDYASFRGYFLAGVPPSGAGEFGFCYDAHPATGVGGFYDRPGSTNFYDGLPTLVGAQVAQIVSQLTRVKAGGVGFDVYVESVGCP